MSRLAASRIAHLCFASSLLLSVPLASHQSGSNPLRQHIPDRVMAAAGRRGSPEGFVRALAALHVPAGLVLRQYVGSSPESSDLHRPLGTHVLSDAIEEFRREHPDHLVEDRETGIFIAPESSGCVAPLDRPISLEQDGPLPFVLWQVFKLVDPATPQIPPSIVGGGIGLNARGGPDPFTQPVRVRARNESLRATLMDLSRQARGVVWGIRETPGRDAAPSICTLTLLSADQTVFTSYRVQ